MDDAKKKKFGIGIAVTCLVFAVLITVISRPRSSRPKGSRGPMQFLCVNEECNAEYEMDPKDFREQMKGKGSAMMMSGMMGPQASSCIECGEESAYIAMKCQQCEFVFIQSYGSEDYPDRCLECDYSAIEERSNN